MDEYIIAGLGLPLSTLGVDSMLTRINEQLARTGASITREETLMLLGRRALSLRETERVEFGIPAVATICEVIANRPELAQDDIAEALANLQDAFYVLRDELPAHVPDALIAEALCGWVDEWGDAGEAASAPIEDVMAFSPEYVRAGIAQEEPYRIVDDDGREYVYDPAWDYDEYANGWDGERWADDWND